jgi:hypothetical protein
MRTTIELPDELLRQLKVRAALDGVTLKELVTRYVADGLAQGMRADDGGFDAPTTRRRGDLPITIPARGRNITALSNAELEVLLDGEDAAHVIAVPGRSP